MGTGSADFYRQGLELGLTGQVRPIEDQGNFVTLGMTLEDTGVMAFNGAGPKLKSEAALLGAGRIVQVEARQAAALRLAAMEKPAPDAFDETIEMKDALAAAKPFIEK